MTIQNPYQKVEYKVFKRSFLQETEVGVEFEPRITTEDFCIRIVPFINNTFNLHITAELDKATERAELKSDDGLVKFEFCLNSAKVFISKSAYTSFSKSALPHLASLVKFLKEVACVELVKRIYINKINLWPIESKNSKLSFRGASYFIFKKEHIEDLANINFEESDFPVSAAKEAVVKCGDSASLKAVLRVELKDATNACFSLGLRAQAESIMLDDVITYLPILNEIIFGAFTDIVSENIFDLMSKESL